MVTLANRRVMFYSPLPSPGSHLQFRLSFPLFFNTAFFSFRLIEEICLLKEKPKKSLVVEWFVSRTLVNKYLRRKSCAHLLHPSQLWWKASGWGKLWKTQYAWVWRNRRLQADRMRPHDDWVTASAYYLCVLSNEVGERCPSWIRPWKHMSPESLIERSRH